MKKLSAKEKEILREQVVAFAEKFVGTPYKYGASASEAPKYFDCSGFVQYIYKHFGFKIPRSTILQAAYVGKKVKNIRDIKLADLIFYRSIRGHYSPRFPNGIGHLAIYIGGGRAIHAVSKVIKDYPARIERGWVKNQTLKKIKQIEKEIVVIKRII